MNALFENLLENIKRKMLKIPKYRAGTYNSINKQTMHTVLERYQNKPIPQLSYATVPDFCDSADFLPQIVRFESTLKDVQRPWAVKAILGTVPVGSKILEIGGGEPLVSGFLQELGYQVTLIDPYDGSGNGPQEYHRFRRSYPKVRIIREYFKKDSPALAGEVFDCIFSVSVLEHIPTEELQSLFDGIDQFLKPGGRSIHCIDDVVDGPTADWHFQEVREILALQHRLQHPSISFSDARRHAEDELQTLYVQLQKDIETYYLSPLEFYRWKNEMSYEEYPFRKIVSVQTCIIKKI
jgi:2-polyprenyl-3-methyl-5-hydroxy-6-metoxy-1,4-benzoquinol methylase